MIDLYLFIILDYFTCVFQMPDNPSVSNFQTSYLKLFVLLVIEKLSQI